VNGPVHDRDCASVTTRYAYCDCAISTRNCRTLAQLAAFTPLERARREQEAAVLRRLCDEAEYATDPSVVDALHRILTGEEES
jgi:hypothetical protein